MRPWPSRWERTPPPKPRGIRNEAPPEPRARRDGGSAPEPQLVGGPSLGCQRSATIDRQLVVEPAVVASGANPIIDGLRTVVVSCCLPDELGRTMLAAALQAGGNQPLGHPQAARLGGHIQVVHHPDAGGGQR